MNQTDLINLAKSVAAAHQLFPYVVCAICEKESEPPWNPWCYRYEPAFYVRYVEPQFNDGKISITEAHGRAISWGLMQCMGQSVRELGYIDWFPKLCDPATGLEWGCRLFAEKLRHASGNYGQALQLWNGGANPDYGSEVLELSAKYTEAT